MPANLADRDPWLEPYRDVIGRRNLYYGDLRHQIENQGGLLGPISEGHRYFGINVGYKEGERGFWYREWAPGARRVNLVGEFNGWDRERHPATRDEYGVWRLFLPWSEVGQTLVHESRYKVYVESEIGGMDRIPAYAKRVLQESDQSFAARLWMPDRGHEFLNPRPTLPQRQGLRIYEAHVGIAQEEGKVGSYDEFRLNVLPRIAALGYDAIQLMAIQEHPFYGSYGYQVSSFFAPSSRFGTPDQLRTLIDAAHGYGLLVLLDLVHSHAVKNTAEGLNLFDGTQHQYFHDGAKGVHPLWDSMLFDYSKPEVRRFLLSNVRYWLEDFQFDGFRFDGVTSMLYLNHGVGSTFGSMDEYFSPNVDDEALTYLKLANDVARACLPGAVTVAEDVSGMPGIARTTGEGGVGFDYRLNMGVADYWIKLLKEKKDEDWRLGEIYGCLLNRRHDEKHIGYVESHDQALVGDKTIAFWLMDAEMYSGMANDRQSLVIDRGIALHKMIRLITFTLAGEGYLNFMGNEFGHPEWIDMPRAGNHDSYHYARRQWSLVDNGFLRYAKLNAFDKAMQALDIEFGVLTDPLIEQLALHEDTRQLVYRRGPLVFVFNFHATESYQELRVPVPDRSDYRLVLTTDSSQFGGFSRIDEALPYIWQDVPMYGRNQSIQIYLPCRTAMVFAPKV
jgi:1,4-alpha-glucan branching enzyme